MADLKIIVLEGDDTGQELLEEALRVLDPSVTQVEATFERHDLSLENRRATDNEAVLDAARAMTDAGFGLKAPTVTPEGADDVGSPNRILREQVDGKVIIRTGRRIPGVSPFAGVHFPISVCRMAVGDAYGAKQWRERDPDSDDELAFRRSASRVPSAAPPPSTRSGLPQRSTGASTAGPSGPSARYTRGC